jgi:2',3'-cyclic-nucleotide 2'-phosphodiesterase (5'-nucleotidase family)
MVVCSGDIFSGNPVVDNHEQKGYPMIDVMNKVGFDISTIGNHEFDYGESNLKEQLLQSEFEWVCANVDMNTTGIPEPNEYKTITKNNVKVTFLGLVETNGK